MEQIKCVQSTITDMDMEDDTEGDSNFDCDDESESGDELAEVSRQTVSSRR